MFLNVHVSKIPASVFNPQTADSLIVGSFKVDLFLFPMLKSGMVKTIGVGWIVIMLMMIGLAIRLRQQAKKVMPQVDGTE
ncbi:hypothetical protein KK083_07215 [Fulvivirgaceae bacterium PWU4]|uniref:Uncharacterized protein n=1 Tax=Chryseosolibacter histidini TaxID=2782349 RepID=A0AAP2DHZ9_9BACT|nr:hypothetical protein [Chryseosolibacter histidini]MBT1696656.1 hypothetical protein [Chryseosolibacter histidini]